MALQRLVKTMGRKARDFYKGGIYHIIQRGNNKAYIFDDQLDKAMFLNIIKETIDKYPCHFLYYVLMDNHYHLVIEMKNVELSTIMRDINRCYSKYYNKKYSRTGTIFGNRYTSQVVSDTKYFLQLLQYIANNPVKADLVKHPSQYKWCAHLEMVSRQAILIDKSKLLSYIDTSFSNALMTYLEMIDGKNTGITKFYDVKDLTANNRYETLETLLQETMSNEMIVQMIQYKTRTAKIQDAKINFIRTAKSKGYKSVEIAQLLNISKRGVNYLVGS